VAVTPVVVRQIKEWRGATFQHKVNSRRTEHFWTKGFVGKNSRVPILQVMSRWGNKGPCSWGNVKTFRSRVIDKSKNSTRQSATPARAPCVHVFLGTST